jgi:hypothetical protein
LGEEAGEEGTGDAETPLDETEPVGAPGLEGAVVVPLVDDIGEDVTTGRLRLLPSRNGMSGPFWPQPLRTAMTHAAHATRVMGVARPAWATWRAGLRKAILPAQPASTAKLFD